MSNGNLRTNLYSTGANVVAGYDALNRVTSLTDGVGSSAFTYTSFGAFQGALATEDGPWTSDTLTHGYINHLSSSLSLAQPTGSWTNGYTYDALK